MNSDELKTLLESRGVVIKETKVIIPAGQKENKSSYGRLIATEVRYSIGWEEWLIDHVSHEKLPELILTLMYLYERGEPKNE